MSSMTSLTALRGAALFWVLYLAILAVLGALKAMLPSDSPTAMLFGVAASVWGGLAMPIGIHAGVNLARWAVGSRGAPGVWSITVPADAEARLASLCPVLGVPTVLVIAAIIWHMRTIPHRDTPR